MRYLPVVSNPDFQDAAFVATQIEGKRFREYAAERHVSIATISKALRLRRERFNQPNPLRRGRKKIIRFQQHDACAA